MSFVTAQEAGISQHVTMCSAGQIVNKVIVKLNERI